MFFVPFNKMVASAVLAFGLMTTSALGQTPPNDVNILNNRDFITEAKQRTSTFNGTVDQNAEMIFQKLRLLKTPKGRRVCGEIQDNIDQTWMKFYTDLDMRGAEIEPFASNNLDLLLSYQDQCSSAIRALPPGGKGKVEDIRSCEVSSLVSQAKLARAKFALLFEISCSEEIWPVILRE